MSIRKLISGRGTLAIAGTLFIAGCASSPRQTTSIRPAPNVSPPTAIAPSRPSAPINVNLTEQEALWHLRSGLNVAALSCRTGKMAGIASSYNRMLARHKVALAAANAAEIAPFRARYGAKWSSAYDTHATRLYNFFAMPTAQAQFCIAASQVLVKATALSPEAITSYAPAALAQLEAPLLRRSNYARR